MHAFRLLGKPSRLPTYALFHQGKKRPTAFSSAVGLFCFTYPVLVKIRSVILCINLSADDHLEQIPIRLEGKCQAFQSLHLCLGNCVTA